ncbi:hypothetical protein [Blastomonas fulva]|jgi:hypothetical protein|uniref:hypothetical protein n=1 Tax=Blastomonas fulva TaxID=1550728 RepID=UPI003D271EA1
MTVATKIRKPARAKPKDFRVKLTAENYAALVAHIAAAGFSGEHAKQDWLRSHVPQMHAAKPVRKARPPKVDRRMPMPGGQAALALLGNVGSDLRAMRKDLQKMIDWLDRIDPVFIADEHRHRVLYELPSLMQQLLVRLHDSEAQITPRLSSAIDQLAKLMRR